MPNKRKKAADSPPVGDASLPEGSGSNSLVPPGDPVSSRRKKSATSRIGRACDRCQHRKLACDPAPEGCPPCQRVNAWCTVTDPLTGTPTYRGEFEYLENQVSKQHDDIRDLVDRLKTLGEDVSAYEVESKDDKRYRAWMQVKASGDTRPWDRDEKQQNVSRHLGSQPLPNGSGPINGLSGPVTVELPLPLEAPTKPDSMKLPDLRSGLADTDPRRYVGVALQHASNDAPKLNLLGWQINLAHFTSGDLDESTEMPSPDKPIYDRSLRSFMATAFGSNPRISHIDLPPKEETLGYASMYIQVLECFAPIFHGPTFLELVCKFYDNPGFRPTAAEEVCVHMLVSLMLYQGAVRNFEDAKAHIHARSDRHYHYSLGFFSKLLLGSHVQDMQALVFIAMHVRNFPKPEIGWMVSSMVFNKLIQLGYHRSSKAVNANRTGKTFRDLELQKRVFHTCLIIVITAGGKLGRPMPIRLEDFDVETPLPIPDEQLLESSIDTSIEGQCTFLVGIEAQKVGHIYLELYNVMYATKRSSKEYMQYVGIAERRIKAWEDQWPSKFKEPIENADVLTRIFISYLNFWSLEFRLLLHHPSLSLTKSFQFNDNNLRSCLAAARGMLQVVKRVQELKSLDTTWYNCAVYMLAIQTTFYGYDQLKDELTDEKLAELKGDMDSWLSIMGDIGGLLGSGRRLQNAVGEQIKIGVTQLEKHLQMKKQAEDEKQRTIKNKVEPKKEPGSQATDTSNIPRHRPSIGGYSDSQASAGGFQGHAGFAPPPGAVTQTMNINAYQAPVQYGFQNSGANAYNPANTGYGQSYPVNMAAQALSSSYGQHDGIPATGHMQNMYDASTNGYGPGPGYSADSDSWYNYAQSIPSGIGPQDYQPASALLQLGGRSELGGNMQPMAEGYDTSSMSGGHGLMWPLGVMGEDGHGHS